METLHAILTTLGLTLKNSIVAAVGSFVALRFFENLSMTARWSTFLGGWALSAWGATPLTEWLELRASMEVGLVLLISFFGMALTAGIWTMLRDAPWAGIGAAIIKRIGGGTP